MAVEIREIGTRVGDEEGEILEEIAMVALNISEPFRGSHRPFEDWHLSRLLQLV